MLFNSRPHTINNIVNIRCIDLVIIYTWLIQAGGADTGGMADTGPVAYTVGMADTGTVVAYTGSHGGY